MLREEIRQRSKGYIGSGQLDLREVRTLYDVQRRLRASQIALGDIIGIYPSQNRDHGRPSAHNGQDIAKWRSQLQGIEEDLALIARLILEYGAEERLQ